MRKSLFFFFLIIVAVRGVSQNEQDSMISQRISYNTVKVAELYLVWTTNNWQVPEQAFQPSGTYVKNGMAYSKMNRDGTGFNIDLKLPRGKYVDCMFYATQDSTGEKSEAWDTHWGANYNILVDGEKKSYDDATLDFVKIEKKPKTFQILNTGKSILLFSLLFFLFVLGYLFLRYKKISFPVFNQLSFFAAFVIMSFVLMMVIRLQMNGHIFKNQQLVFGSSFYDMVFMSVLASFFIVLFFIVKKYRIGYFIVSTISILLITAIIVFSLLNVEIVKQIGKPLNYSWLYYADFLKATDAKNALKANMNGPLNKNIIYIVLATLICSVSVAMLFYKSGIKQRMAIIFALSFAVIFGLLGFYQLQRYEFNDSNVKNPVYVLGSSWINPEKKAALFTMKISAEVTTEIQRMHKQTKSLPAIPGADSISNVVFFVLESTPAGFVQAYDSTYRVTPTIAAYKKDALLFRDIYSHQPNTASSLFTLISGMYPMISYKSIMNEYTDLEIPTVPQILQDNAWRTSLFFSSDLTYNKMGEFLNLHGFEKTEDMKTIPCEFEKFQSNYAQLDGLDDRCPVKQYLKWKDSFQASKSFSIIWTNQTHYPYFTNEKRKYTDNKELNPYLNALSEVDKAFGQLMEGLKARKQLDNTLVIVVGDHGEAFGTHGQYSHGSQIYEENLHVPLMFINSKLFKGEDSEKLGGLIDLAPTLFHLLKIQCPRTWEGVSLLGDQHKSHSFFVGPFSDFLVGSRFDNWKLIYNTTQNKTELYDIKNDPGELKNLAEQQKELVKKEKEMIGGWVQYHTKTIDSLIK